MDNGSEVKSDAPKIELDPRIEIIDKDLDFKRVYAKLALYKEAGDKVSKKDWEMKDLGFEHLLFAKRFDELLKRAVALKDSASGEPPGPK